MEILLTILLEPFLYAYFDLIEQLVDGRKLKKSMKCFLMILCACVSLFAFFLVIIGVFWVLDAQPFKTYGTVMLIVGMVILFAHILISVLVGVEKTGQTEQGADDCDDVEEDANEPYSTKDEPKPIIYYIDENSEDDSVVK